MVDTTIAIGGHGGGSGSLIVMRFAETLRHHTVLHVKAVSTTTRISDEKFTPSVVQAHAGYVSGSKVFVYRNKASISCIPHLDALGVRRDKRVKDGIIEDTKAGVLVSEVMVDRFIVVVEDERATGYDNALRVLRHHKSI